MVSRFKPRTIVVLPSAPRIIEGDGNDFVSRVNEGLHTEPLFRLGTPAVIPYLLETYYQSLEADDEVNLRVGRVAAYYLQGMRPPFTDRRPGDIIKDDAYMAVTRSIARVINEQRAAKKNPSASDVASDS